MFVRYTDEDQKILIVPLCNFKYLLYIALPSAAFPSSTDWEMQVGLPLVLVGVPSRLRCRSSRHQRPLQSLPR
jgi:hypothetical protein